MANKKNLSTPSGKNRGASGKGEVVVLDVERARRELEKVVDSLSERYGFDGLIDDEADEFATEYDRAVNDIMQPFLSAKDADALGELAIARLSQLLRINIMDDDEFADYELDEIETQLDLAFDYGTDEQRAHLLDLLGTYLKNVLGESREWMYDYERNAIEDFIGDNFAGDAHFSAEVIELADWHLERVKPNAVDVANKAVAADLSRELLASMNEMDKTDLVNMLNYALTGKVGAGEARDAARASWADLMGKAEQVLDNLERGNIKHARMHWALTRMVAMSARGDSGDALYEYAKELDVLSFTETLYLITEAYGVEGQPRKAIAVLRENADAVDMYMSSDWESEPTLVDYMLDLAWAHYSKVELIDLYRELLLNESYVTNFDMYDRAWQPEVMNWYDQLHGMVGDSEWGDMREELLASVSDKRKKVLLAHEEFLLKFYRHILEVLGEEPLTADLRRADYTGPVPLLPATYYICYAETFAQKAKTRAEYQKIGMALIHAAALCDEASFARECAAKIAAAYPRKYALHEELRMFGFEV